MKRTLICLGVLFEVFFSSPFGSQTARAEELHFPPDFRWCVATAAHQIEGGNTESDWWDFEFAPGATRDGDKSGQACDHWNRLEEDTQLLKKLNVRTYRFSIEWAKIEPRPGEWDLEALAHYQKEIRLLREDGIEPMITLQHFTLPRWVVELGAWEWEGFPEAFRRYTEFVYTGVGSEVQDWITFNEPMVLIGAGYVEGLFPPLKKDAEAAGRAIVGMLTAHAEAYHAIHELAGPKAARVGFAHHLRIFEPKYWLNPFDWYAAYKLDEIWNWAFSRAPETGEIDIYVPFKMSIQQKIMGLKGTQDFIGVNYYSRDKVHLNLSNFTVERSSPEGAPVSDIHWEIYPEGMYRILKKVAEHFPGRPVLITENGVADHTDQLRKPFLLSHLEALYRAMKEGVPVEGYCHWSLMDNFEWRDGYTPRFGLYEVNYSTQERIPRESAELFSKIAASGTLIISDSDRRQWAKPVQSDR